VAFRLFDLSISRTLNIDMMNIGLSLNNIDLNVDNDDGSMRVQCIGE
jgi:hypothetical protein